jgi:hypothetical protein
MVNRKKLIFLFSTRYAASSYYILEKFQIQQIYVEPVSGADLRPVEEEFAVDFGE